MMVVLGFLAYGSLLMMLTFDTRCVFGAILFVIYVYKFSIIYSLFIEMNLTVQQNLKNSPEAQIPVLF